MSARRVRLLGFPMHSPALRLSLLLIVLGFTACPGLAGQITTNQASSAADDARAVSEVTRLRNIALAIAQGAAQASNKIASLGQSLRSEFDAVAIAESVLGPFWNSASADEQYDTVQAFSDILAQVAVSQFEKYRELPFAFKEVIHLANGDFVVVSQFTQQDGRTVQVDWRLRLRGNTFNFVDISIDAKSMVVKYRQDASDRIRTDNNSVRAFIVSLRDRLPKTPY